MKKILLSVAAAVAVMVSFTGCGKDDGGSGSGSGSIVGKWKATHLTEYERADGNVWYKTDEVDINYEWTLQLLDDGTFIETDVDGEFEGNYTYDESTKKLSLYNGDKELTISKLTTSQLVTTEEFREEYGLYKWEVTYKKIR